MRRGRGLIWGVGGGGVFLEKGGQGYLGRLFFIWAFFFEKENKNKNRKKREKKMPSWEKNAKKRLFEKKRGRIFFLFF